MTGPGRRLLRRLRFGRPIVIVSGLPRSGTSMAMRMLAAGGLPLFTDGGRGADADNPHGYFEHSRVLTIDKPGDASWLAGARGKGIKVVSALVPHLPETFQYKVIFMQRDLREVVASQHTMLGRRGRIGDQSGDDRLIGQYEAHLKRVAVLLGRRPCFETLEVRYEEVLADPGGQAARMRRFLGLALDVRAMAGSVDPALYRHRG